MKDFDASNWFWYVGGDRTKAFSSKLGDYVASTDANFQAWMSDGTVPTSIDTEANLGAALAPYLLRPTNANVLDGYTNAQADEVLVKVAFKMLFNHENRIRALEGKAAITASQARAALKALL